MGWIHEYHAAYHKANGTVDRRRCLDTHFNWSSGGITRRVLKSAMVGSVYYAAVAVEEAGKPMQVTAVVCLTCGRTKWDGTEWGFKDMDETFGPNESKCPASILALLTPIDSQWANEWRERCRKNIAEAAARRKNGPLPLYAPTGVTITEEGRSWIITGEVYRRRTGYAGCRFTKAKWHTSDNAMRVFLDNYGTPEQKREYAASGRDCPKDWKEAAA